jgi:hypothetical protein
MESATDVALNQVDMFRAGGARFREMKLHLDRGGASMTMLIGLGAGWCGLSRKEGAA